MSIKRPTPSGRSPHGGGPVHRKRPERASPWLPGACLGLELLGTVAGGAAADGGGDGHILKWTVAVVTPLRAGPKPLNPTCYVGECRGA